MIVEVWQDYVCPWAYLGRHRSAVLRELGIATVPRPFELHPDTPAAPAPVRPGGRHDQVLGRIAAECAELGLAFTPPRRTPNTRLALVLAETVRIERPDRFAALDDALFSARFEHDADLSDPAVLADIAATVDLDADRVDRAGGEDAATVLAASMTRAREHGVAATPAWLFPTGFVIPGVHDPEAMRRWATRIIERSEPAGRIDVDG